MRGPWIAPMLLAFPGAAFAQSVDLTAISADVSPSSVELGTMVTVSGMFGGTHTGNVEYRVVISEDTTLDQGDRTLQTDTAFFDGSGNPLAFSTSFAMPVVTAATWNVFVEVDSAGQVAESDETNNRIAAAQMLTMRGADLRVESITGPEYGFAGGPYRVEMTIVNQGQTAANDFQYVYYYSDTPQIRVFSTQIGQGGPVSVPAGGQITVSDVVMLPTSTATGYIGVIVDQFGAVPESNLNNNIARIPGMIRILEPSPELSGRFIEVPTQAAIGEQLAITRALANMGAAVADFEYAFYLSTDPSISTSDVELGRFDATLDPMTDDYVIDLMNVPFDVAAGYYYVGLIVDPEDTDAEPDETDNTALGPQIQIYESAIQFTTEAFPDATVGVPYEIGVYATGPLIVTFSIGDGDLPDGLTLDPAGIITGTPTRNGRFDFTVRAHAGTAVAERRFSILVVETSVRLEVVPSALPTGVRGRTYVADLIAVGGQTPYTWSAATELPEGLELSAEGHISGTPEEEGEYPVSVRVEDALGEADGHDFILRVIAPDQTLAVGRIDLPSAIVGKDYCDQSTIRFEVLRGVEPFRWSAIGELPPGMSLDPDGSFCGTPTEVGNFPLVIRVQDQTGLFDSALLTFEVLGGTTFAISTTTLPDVDSGAPYDAAVEAFGGEGTHTFTLVAGAGDLPPGLELSTDGKITGTPVEAGVFAFIVHVVDAVNRSDTQPLSIVVRAKQGLKKEKGGCTCVSSGTANAGALSLLLLIGLFSFRGHSMRKLLTLFLSSVTLVLGCSKDVEVFPVEVVSFGTVDGETQIQAGDTVTFAWETKNAETVQIVATPPGTPLPNVAGASGMVTTEALFEPTTFQLNATGTDGSRDSSDAVRIEVRGIRIQRFTATPTSIDPGGASTLEWAIGGDAPTEVTLTDDGGVKLFTGDSATGSFDVEPIVTTTYTLAATAESGTDEETVQVMVADVPPMIEEFTATPNPVAIGSLTQLSWRTSGASEVRVLQDGVVVRDWQSIENGTRVSRPVTGPAVEFTLEAMTPTMMMVDRTITVTGLDVPVIDQLDLSPVAYTGASTAATIVWSTSFTNQTALQVNGQPQAGFPGSASGTYDFTVSGGTANVTLIATNEVGEARETGRILAGFDEPEPNDTATTAIALTGDGLPVRGTIDGGDADYYSVMVPEGARIEAMVGWDGAMCSFDTMLELYDSDGTTRLGGVDDTQFPAINPCSRINPAAHAWADDLAAGTYHLRVSSSSTAPGATGTYSLEVEVTGPEAPLPGVTVTPMGTPIWRIADVVQISVLIGNANTDPTFRFLQESFDELTLPLYSLEGFVGTTAIIHPIFRPFDPLARDYDGVLSAAAAIAGYESKTTFTVEEFAADNAILTLFVIEPDAGAPVESSYDFPSGPVLPTELFPMSIDYDIVKDAMPYYEGDPFQLPGYHQYMPAVPGSGSSHRVTGTVLADFLAPAGTDPEGVYETTYVVLDAGGQGWTVTVPLTVTP